MFRRGVARGWQGAYCPSDRQNWGGGNQLTQNRENKGRKSEKSGRKGKHWEACPCRLGGLAKWLRPCPFVALCIKYAYIVFIFSIDSVEGGVSGP